MPRQLLARSTPLAAGAFLLDRDVEAGCSGPLQIVDGDRLCGVVRCGVGSPRRRNGLVAGVVVRTIFLVQPPMRCRLFLVAQLRVDERKIVVRGQVFGIVKQCLFETLDRAIEEFITLCLLYTSPSPRD